MPKPDFHFRLAQASERLSDFDLDAILARLRAGENLLAIAADFCLLPDEEERDHLHRHWYYGTDQERCWPTVDVERLVRDGYIELLELIKLHKKPVKAKWTPNQLAFRVGSSLQGQHILFEIETPRPDHEHPLDK